MFHNHLGPSKISVAEQQEVRAVLSVALIGLIAGMTTAKLLGTDLLVEIGVLWLVLSSVVLALCGRWKILTKIFKRVDPHGWNSPPMSVVVFSFGFWTGAVSMIILLMGSAHCS